MKLPWPRTPDERAAALNKTIDELKAELVRVREAHEAQLDQNASDMALQMGYTSHWRGVADRLTEELKEERAKHQRTKEANAVRVSELEEQLRKADLELAAAEGQLFTTREELGTYKTHEAAMDHARDKRYFDGLGD